MEVDKYVNFIKNRQVLFSDSFLTTILTKIAIN